MRLISKAIVGAAVATACSYVTASTITNNTLSRDLSLEGLQVTTGTTSVVTDALNWTLGDAWVLNDTVDFTTNKSFGSVDRHAVSFTCANGANNSTVFNIVSGSSNASNIRYSASTPVGVTSNQVCAIPTIAVLASSIASAGTVTISAAGRKAATLFTFDTSAAATVMTVASEYTVTLKTALNGQIDVQGGRLSFVNTAGTADDAGSTLQGNNADVFAVSIARTVRTQITSVLGSLVVTLTAGSSFGYLQELAGTGSGSCSVADGSGVAQATATGLLAAASLIPNPTSGSCTTLTATFLTVAPGAYNIFLGRANAWTANATNDAPFAQQTYSATASMSQGATALASSGSLNAGTWTINGTTVNIPYVPISSSINLQIFVANRSAQAGVVNFTAWNASGTSCTGTLGNIDANANGSYGTTLRAALQACTGTGWSDAARATVQLVTPTPSTTTAVHTSFGVTDTTSRQILINDTNGK